MYIAMLYRNAVLSNVSNWNFVQMLLYINFVFKLTWIVFNVYKNEINIKLKHRTITHFIVCDESVCFVNIYVHSIDVLLERSLTS